MGCCKLETRRAEAIIDGKLEIFLACKDCGIRVNVRIYPVSGRKAEIAEYFCTRCGLKDRRGRPSPEEALMVNIVSDWRSDDRGYIGAC